jgi:hypothetical protein
MEDNFDWKNTTDANALQIDATRKTFNLQLMNIRTLLFLEALMNQAHDRRSYHSRCYYPTILIFTENWLAVLPLAVNYMVRQINWRTICNCKMEWSASPEEMLYKNQPKFIKFALGENVKQSSLSNSNPTRFPSNRRMVETGFTDYFQRAKEYDDWKTYSSNSKKKKHKSRFRIANFSGNYQQKKDLLLAILM